MSKNRIKPIDEATALLWKTELINELKSSQPFPKEMETDLLEMLKPHYKRKGYYILEPLIKFHSYANFIRSGKAKLFKFDDWGEQHMIHLWGEKEFMVYFKLFRRRRENTVYYIELLEDCELVCISRDDVEILYKRYQESYELTLDMLEKKMEQKENRIEILDTIAKVDRPGMLDEMFPKFKNKLSNSDKNAFIGTGNSTLYRANHSNDKDKRSGDR